MSQVNPTSGLWLGSVDDLSPMEFIAACCRRNTVDNPFISKAKSALGGVMRQDLLCRCSSNSSPMPIDPFGCHLMGCKIDAHAIRLHDNVVHKLVALL